MACNCKNKAASQTQASQTQKQVEAKQNLAAIREQRAKEQARANTTK